MIIEVVAISTENFIVHYFAPGRWGKYIISKL